MRFVPALDGYRGLAVLLVILFHAQWLPFGWVGVSLFFILSSYLITSVLLKRKEEPALEFFGNFWKHRLLRLLPLYFLYLLVVGLLVPPGVFESLGLATFTFNFVQLFKSVEPNHQYGHLWALAVEMQFYLVWPILIWFLNERWLRRLAFSLIVLAPASRYLGGLLVEYLQALNGLPHTSSFLLPSSHLDTFGRGALLALPKERDRGLLWIGAGAALITIPVAFLAPKEIWTGAFVSAGGALLLLMALQASYGPPARWHRWFLMVFTSKPLTYAGLISYGLYVWHYALTEWLEDLWTAPLYSPAAAGRLGAILAASFGVASLSYHFFEKHFLRHKRFELAPEESPVEVR